MKLTEIPAPDFDLAMTLGSGQVFHWENAGDGFIGAIADRPVYVEHCGDLLKVHDGETPSSAREARGLPRRNASYFALGYRAETLLATARLVASGEADLEKLATLPDVDLRAHLCELPGVGAKVANCVMLFAYERLRAFPIDVWIERVLRENYFPRARKLNAARLRAFTEGYFVDHGGHAQQDLFHHVRTNKTKMK